MSASLSPVGDRVGLAIDQIAQFGLSSLKGIDLFRARNLPVARLNNGALS
ncbi:Uncharacterised protein [Yersinia enterocolitica]|nr:Uncharacterised protein [Yersinia enterocolitica]